MNPTVINPGEPSEQTNEPVAPPPNADVNAPVSQPQPEVGLPPLGVENAAPLPPKKSSKKGLILVVLALLLVAAGTVFAFSKLKKENPAVTQADQAPKEVAELRLGTDQPPLNALYPDPNFVAGAAFSVNFQLYEGLVGFKNANSLVPLLAESWTTPDDTTWIFKLKPNVKFHTGKLMTAEDVRRSIDAAVKDENSLQLLVGTIKSVTVQDPEHVVIKTTEPDALLLNRLPYIFIQSKEKVNGALAGTGGYTLAPDFKPTDNELRLVAFDDYHLGKPAVRTAKYLKFEEEADVYQAMKDGKVDLTDFMTKTGHKLAELPGFTKTQFSIGDIGFLGINTKKTGSPLAKVEVRRAIKLAIDPEVYKTNVGRVGNIPTQMTSQANFGYDPSIPAPKQDIPKAKALLKEAGYPNGITLSLHFSGNEANQASYVELKKQLAEIGVKLTDDGSDAEDAPFAKIDSGQTDLYLLTVTSAILDSYDIFSLNFRSVNFDNADLNKLLDDSNKEFDVAKRKQLMQAASRLIVDQVAAIPLVENLSTYFVRSDLSYHIDPAGYAFGGYIRAISGK